MTRTSVYNSHLREPLVLTPVAERLAVELSLPVLTTEDSNTQPSACEANVLTHCVTDAADTNLQLYNATGRITFHITTEGYLTQY